MNPFRVILSLAVIAVCVPLVTPQAEAQRAVLQAMAGQWSGDGRAATSSGEAPIRCAVSGDIVHGQLSMSANCASQGQSATIAMLLSYSDMSRRFTGQLLSPLNYISGSLYGQMDRGDVLLRLSADDGSTGRLMFVGLGSNSIRLLVTTNAGGRNITVLDLPLRKQSL